jgi:hypothetical protein
LDFFIAVTSSMEAFFTNLEASRNISGVRMLRVVRISRLVRVCRVIRVVGFITALRTLVDSIACTLKSLGWALLLLAMIIYVFGILFTQAVVDFVYSNGHADDPGDQELLFFFGSLGVSTLTLYQAVTGGMEWRELTILMERLHFVWTILLMAYIAFILFAVLNVVTGVFCNSAIENAQHDHDVKMHAQMERKRADTLILQKLFSDVDKDASGSITLGEFERYLADEKIVAYFSSLQLDVSEAWKLFKLIDADESHVIDLEEFIEGCLRLRGPAKALDLADILYQNEGFMKKVTDFMTDMDTKIAAIIGLTATSQNPSSAKGFTIERNENCDRSSTQGLSQSWLEQSTKSGTASLFDSNSHSSSL